MCLKKIMFIIRGKKHEMHLNNLTPHQWTKVCRLFFFFWQNGFLKNAILGTKNPQVKTCPERSKMPLPKMFHKKFTI